MLVILFPFSLAHGDVKEVLIAPVEPKMASTTKERLEYELPAILKHIALCESGNKANAKNPTSSASGRFQFIKSSWNYYGKQLWGSELKNKNVFDWEDSTELALYVYKMNGTRDWNASMHCWN